MQEYVLNHHSADGGQQSKQESATSLADVLAVLNVVVPRVRDGSARLDAHFAQAQDREFMPGFTVHECVVTELPQSKRLLWFAYAKNVGATAQRTWSSSYGLEGEQYILPPLSTASVLISFSGSQHFSTAPLSLSQEDDTKITVSNVWNSESFKSSSARYEENPKHHPNARGKVSKLDILPEVAQRVLDLSIGHPAHPNRRYGCFQGQPYEFRSHLGNSFHCHRLEEPLKAGIDEAFVERLARHHDASEFVYSPIWGQ